MKIVIGEKELEKLVTSIEAKRKDVRSDDNYSETKFAALDSYNLALTEAAELIRGVLEKK